MTKGRPPRRYLRGTFQCPAKGEYSVNVWPRKGETDQDACWRALSESKIDKAQIQFCKLTNIKVLD